VNGLNVLFSEELSVNVFGGDRKGRKENAGEEGKETIYFRQGQVSLKSSWLEGVFAALITTTTATKGERGGES